jgi:protein SCO1
VTRGFLPLLALVLAAGIGALSSATDGFRVVTSFGARQLAVERDPRGLPDVPLLDQNGRPFSLVDYRGRTVLVDFIYTSCPTICGVLGDDFRNVLTLARGRPDADIDLLSISFDPANDDHWALRQYAARYGATAPHWRVATPANQDGLNALLHAFGVVVIADGFGGFVHSSAVYMIDRRGRLARVLDVDAPSRLIAAVVQGAAS